MDEKLIDCIRSLVLHSCRREHLMGDEHDSWLKGIGVDVDSLIETNAEFQQGMAEGMWEGTKGIISTVQTATDLASGAMLARGAVKLTAAAIDEDARNQLMKETEADAKKLAATAEFSVNMAVNPVGTLGGMAVNTYEGYEEASAKGDGANYAGRVVGKGVVIYTAVAVGAAAGEVGAVEAAAGDGAAAEAGEIGGDVISPMA